MDPQQALFFSRMEPCWGFVRYTLIFRLLKKKQTGRAQVHCPAACGWRAAAQPQASSAAQLASSSGRAV